MSYMNDPREMAIRPESGVTLEQDNRVETMYHWGAMVTDLCDLPVSEYMKPMTVIVYGSGGDYVEPEIPGTIKTENVNIWFTVLRNGNQITDEEDVVLSAGEDADIVWTARWEWTGSFSNTIMVAAVVETESGPYSVSANVIDNVDKKHDEEIVEARGAQNITSYKSYGVAAPNTPIEEVTNTIYTETVEEENTKYKFEVSSAETIVYLTLKLSGVAVPYTNIEMRYGQEIPFDKVNTEKEGYNFLYWADSKGKEYTGTTMPAQNLTLTAKYEVKKCQVDFVFVIDGNEEFVSSTTVNYGSKVTRFPYIDEKVYTLIEWTPSTATTIKVDTEFRAILEHKKYIITWSGYTEGPHTQQYVYGAELEIPSNPEKEGHTFTAWTPTPQSPVVANAKYTARFDTNKYKIQYFIMIDGDKGEPVSSYTQNYGTKITVKSVPSQNGYTFSKWESNYTGTTVPDHNVEYVTVKTPNVYILAYYDNGDLIKEEKYEYRETIRPFPYSKEGYTVSEWKPTLPVEMPYNNVSAYCTSEIMRFTVTFMDQDENIVGVAEGVPYGTPIKDIFPQAPEGHSYNVSEDVLKTLIKEDMNIVVEVSVNEYALTMVHNEVETVISLPYGTNIREYIEANYPPEDGYDLEINATHETIPADNTARVEYRYTPKVLLLTYTTNGSDNDLNGEINVPYGTILLTVLPETYQEGHIFNGWYYDDIKVEENTTMPNKNIVVNGNYEKELYEIRIIDGEEIIYTETCAYKTKLSSVLSNENVKEYVATQSANGYTVSFVLTGETVNEEMEITSNLDIYVEKTPNKYLLIFMNGEEKISEDLVEFGTEINYPPMEDKTEEGIEYVFVWEDSSYNGKPMPAKDLTIVGNYQEKAEAPIYFGTFKVAVSDYDSANTTQYFDEEKLGTKYYNSVNVSECVGDGAKIEVPRISDEYYVSLNTAKRGQYKKATRYPYSFVLPNGLTENYIISLIDGANLDHWNECVTDGQIVMYNGNEYKFYVYYTDLAYPVLTDETMPFTLKLIKK